MLATNPPPASSRGLVQAVHEINARAKHEHSTHIHGHRTLRQDGRLESPTYTTWRSMVQRCHSPKHRSYEGYGALGIKVVPRWRKFKNFLADMGERPPGKTLGRKDPTTDYGPGLCEWQTFYQQNRAAHSHADQMATVVIDGRKVTLTKRMWARRCRIRYKRLLERIRDGWGDAAFTTRKGQRRA